MNESLKLAAVIGHPISHSKSPKMHGYWLEQNKINGHYIPLSISPDDFRRLVPELAKMGFVGANVTIPHKLSALEIATKVSDRAQLIGAANTLTFGVDGEVFADNTDGYGFITNIKTVCRDWAASDGPSLVLGAGGAARAVLSALLDDGAPQILISNRTRSKADSLKRDFGDRISVIDWADISKNLYALNTLINTTSLGMVGKDKMDLDLTNLSSQTLVTDIVYTPLETELLKIASRKGCRTVDGLGMLIYQGIPGFEKWFGKTPIVTPELREILLK